MGTCVSFFLLLLLLSILFCPIPHYAFRGLPESQAGGGQTTTALPEYTYSSPPPPCPPAFESKRLELVYPVIQRFKKRITCDPHGVTDTWVGTDICGKYKGFFCDVVPDFKEKALSGVKFNGFNLDGPDLNLNGFIEELPDISFFHANSNNFTGTIPEKVTKLRWFFELDLSNNKLSGEFPHQILSAPNLTIIDLRFNSFTGSVPSRVFNLDLDLLFINNNGFINRIPDNLWSTRAVFLTLANNRFVGEIPKNIGTAGKRLREVLFLNNGLSGCLPAEMGLLKKARVLDVGRNKLSGPIPYSFGCLKKMEQINLGKNKLSGPIPEVLCQLKKIRNITLSDNYFTEVGPACMKLIEKKILHVKKNCIFGFPYQRPESECVKFFWNPPVPKYCPDEYWIPCSITAHSGSEPYSPPPTHKTYSALDPRKP